MIASFGWAAIVLVATATWALCALFSQFEPPPGISLLAQLKLGRKGSKGGKKLTGKTELPRKFSNKSKARKKGKGKCKTTREIRLIELVEVVARKPKYSSSREGTVGGATNPSQDKKKKEITRRKDRVGLCYKQYVNLEKDMDGKARTHPEYGQYIDSARVAWSDGSKLKLAGKRVIWHCRLWTGTDRPKDGLNDDEKESFRQAGALVTQCETTTDKDGWTMPVVKFYLSTYGGDQFSVSAELVDNQDKRIGERHTTRRYQVWRKMWYAITEMRKPGTKKRDTYKLPENVLDDVKESFEDIYLELEDSKEGRGPGKYTGNFLIPEEAYQWADKARGEKFKKLSPWKMHFVVVNHAARQDDSVVKREDITQSPYDVPNLSFRPYDFEGTKWLLSAQYRRQGTGTWRDFPAGAVRLHELGEGWYTLRVGFARTTMTPSQHNPAEVRIAIQTADPPLGWGGSCLHTVICRGSHDEANWNQTYRDRQLVTTVVHEQGHVFDLVYWQDWKTTVKTQNAHCKHKTCVMWYQVEQERTTLFHPENVGDPGCRTWLRRYRMSRGYMGSWKFPRS